MARENTGAREAVLGLIEEGERLRVVIGGVLDRYGLTLLQYRVLCLIRDAQAEATAAEAEHEDEPDDSTFDAGMTLGELQRRVSEEVTVATPRSVTGAWTDLSRLVDRLVRDGLVRRRRHRVEHRARVAELTEAGVRRLREVEATLDRRCVELVGAVRRDRIEAVLEAPTG